MAKKKVHEELKGSANKIWMAGLGALKVAEEEGSKLFQTLVEHGEKFETRSKKEMKKIKGLLGEAAEKAKDAAGKARGVADQTMDRAVADTLKRLGVPHREEISALGKRVEELTKAVDSLRGGRGAAGASKAPARKPAAKKTTAKKPGAKKGPAKAKRPAATKASVPGIGKPS